MISRIVSLLVAAAFVASYGFEYGWTSNVLGPVVILMVPLALIWFPDEVGDVFEHQMRATGPSPGTFVAAAGWFFLVGLPVIAFLLSGEHK